MRSKNLLKMGVICLSMSMMAACSQASKSSDTAAVQTRSVQFEVGTVVQGGLNAASLSAAAVNVDNAASVSVKIETTAGVPVDGFNPKKIDIQKFGNTLLTAPFSLPVGTYRVSEFLVLDDSDTAILAAPVAGSTLSHLVSQPLSIGLDLDSDEIQTLSVEVLDVAEFTPEAFGYVSFKFDPVDILRMLTRVFRYDETAQSYVAVTANITAKLAGKQDYSRTLESSTNTVELWDSENGNYTLEFSKPGFATQSIQKTRAELLSSQTRPITVYLQSNASAFQFPNWDFLNGSQANNTIEGWTPLDENRGGNSFNDYLAQYDGRQGVLKTYHLPGSTSNGAMIIYKPDTPLPIENFRELTIELSFKIISADLTGFGQDSMESPIQLEFIFRSLDPTPIWDTNVQLFNYTGIASSSRLHVVPRNEWVTVQINASDMAINPNVDVLDYVKIGSTGWAREAYIDYIKVVE